MSEPIKLRKFSPSKVLSFTYSMLFIGALLDGIVGFLVAQPEHSEQVLQQLYTYIIPVGWPVKASLIGLIVFHVLTGHQLLHHAVTPGSLVNAFRDN